MEGLASVAHEARERDDESAAESAESAESAAVAIEDGAAAIEGYARRADSRP